MPGRFKLQPKTTRVLAFGAVVLASLVAVNADDLQRIMFGLKVHETTPPFLPKRLWKPAILVFSKTNGFRHEQEIGAANALIGRLSRQNGWSSVLTEKVV